MGVLQRASVCGEAGRGGHDHERPEWPRVGAGVKEEGHQRALRLSQKPGGRLITDMVFTWRKESSKQCDSVPKIDTDQWNKTKSPEINPSLGQNREEYAMGKRQSRQQAALGTWTATCRRMTLGHLLTPYRKTHSEHET